MEKLRTGVAYHGNRILRHVDEDMRDIVNHHMNLVVHMFSHNDWDRHLGVMKEIVNISKYYGLEVWVDNWGIGGPPGDKSFFLELHPEAHQVYSDGSVDPVSACYNAPSFIEFTKNWLETVREFGGETIFWDEPRFKINKQGAETCHCPTCRKLFEEEYHKPMPWKLTPEVAEFRKQSLTRYFDTVTTHSANLGMKNTTCVMLDTLDYTTQIMKLKHLDDFGIDPYWHFEPDDVHEPYEFVYNHSRQIIDMANAEGKKSHIWIQGYKFPSGTEDEIMTAADAAYDAGARTIIGWSFRGAESNTYKAECCDMTWRNMGEAMRRVRDREADRIREERRLALGLKK